MLAELATTIVHVSAASLAEVVRTLQILSCAFAAN